jgi:hypothetical protein
MRINEIILEDFDPDDNDYHKMTNLRSSLSFPLVLYRAISRDINCINRDNIGTSWTNDIKYAIPYYGSDRHTPTIIKARAKEDDIDWETTFIQNVTYNWNEKEICIKPNNNIKLIAYKQHGDWIPINENKMIDELLIEAYDKSKFVNVDVILDELLSLLPKTLPRPEIKYVNQVRSNWLAQDVWTPGKPNTTISLQQYILQDEYTTKRTLAHELCHHQEFLFVHLPTLAKYGVEQYKAIVKKYITPHGKYFEDFAKVFNDKYGKDFVTKISDQKDVIAEVDKPFNLLIVKEGDNYLVAHSLGKINTAQKDYIEKKLSDFDWKVVETTERMFLNAPKIGTKFSNCGSENAISFAKNLWENGTILLSPTTINKVTLFSKRYYIFLMKGFNGNNDMRIAKGIPKNDIKWMTDLKNPPDWKVVSSTNEKLIPLVGKYIHVDREPQYTELFNELWDNGKVLNQKDK